MSHELEERGLITHTGGGDLAEVLRAPRKVYLGIDPSADSLHVGNLVPVILMKHLYDLGHEPHFLIGGATGLIGDPRESGERSMLDPHVVSKNARAIKKQLSSILGKRRLVVFNNADWLGKVGLIEFLRDTGKYFTVNQLIKRDIVKRRLETEEDSISFTEFSYALLQAYDYLYLNEKRGIDLQIGGSDQWSNIISGVDLIRRKKNRAAFALTTPIVTDKSTGKKFGKSEGNAVWLDPQKTSPFSFYQFWINVSDENLAEYLKIFTFLPLAAIAETVSTHGSNPGDRSAQKVLARSVTAFVHGEEVARAVERVSELVYSGDLPVSLSRADRALLLKEMPHVRAARGELSAGIPLADVLVRTGLATSKSDARRLLEGGGVSVNGRVLDEQAVLTSEHLKDDLAFVRKGKKTALLVLN